MTPAHERFARWLREHGHTRAAAAKLLECSDVFVGMLERGERVPGLAIAHAIEHATSGWAEGPIRTEEWIARAEPAPTAPEAAA